MINFLWIRKSLLSSLFMLTIVSAPILAISSAHADDMSAAVSMQTVNINTADAKSLAKQLIGVGTSRAKKIVKYRDSHGPFSSAEDLSKIKGISKNIVEKNKERIVLE